jgi:Na+-translocating ferredoxin:NAD+ oxidoreductase RNF subunit RnfB
MEWLKGIIAAVVAAATVVAFAALPRGRQPKPPDQLVSAVLAVLPGGNCGACGNGSCFEAATAVAAGRAPASVCAVGDERTAENVAAVLRSHGVC